MTDKSLIKKRFSKNLASYDKEATVQKKMAKKLLSYVSEKKYESILEIGCGTGFLTNLVYENIDFENYIAIDIVDECESYINKISSQIVFYSEDIEKYLEQCPQKFDLIISNASLQWIDDFENIVIKLINKLNQNGELVFSTFGKENFREIYHLLGTGLNYYSVNELNKIFNNYSPQIDEEIYITSYKTPKDVLKHLKHTGVNALNSKSWTKHDLAEFESGYNNICTLRPILTYNPIYLKIKN